jgi:hypothetical protein
MQSNSLSDEIPKLMFRDIRLSLAPSTQIKLYLGTTVRTLQKEVTAEGPDPWADAIIGRGSDRGSRPTSEVKALISGDTQSFTMWSESVSRASTRQLYRIVPGHRRRQRSLLYFGRQLHGG